jgi:hypothetical protein
VYTRFGPCVCINLKASTVVSGLCTATKITETFSNFLLSLSAHKFRNVRNGAPPESTPNMRIRYLGHSCFLIETGSHKLLIDPFISGNELATVSADSVECDFILLSHGHDDHTLDALPIAKRCGATIVAPFELAEYLGAQGAKVHDMNPGGAYEFPFGRLKLTHAIHSSSTGGGLKPISASRADCCSSPAERRSTMPAIRRCSPTCN